jgi:ABC-type transport system involved in cytochrome bd biosynthesis fused ATPase/permease subunit
MIRSFVIRALPIVALLIVGAIILAIGGSHTIGFALGFGTIGIAGVLLAALFFYEVGRSEDRARASRGNDGSPESRGV